MKKINKSINNKTILVTGGTGSFGKMFVKYVLDNYKPKKIIIFSRDELKQFNMQEHLKKYKKKLRFFLGDIRDKDRLDLSLKNVDYVIHAAALKQVPAAEYNPIEAIKTNVLGAQNLLLSCINNKVKKLIALSTDKAVNPINLYGATKLSSDKLLIAANNLSGTNGTKFSAVRYGNVLSSRGSVIPIFNSIKKDRKKVVPITNMDMTRFFISKKNAVEFVVDCLNVMKGGEIFVPKIRSLKISELAQTIIKGCKIKVIGVRPGEKIHEVLISREESIYTKEFKNLFIIYPIILDKKKFSLKKKLIRFEYSSNLNKYFLKKNQIYAFLKKHNQI